MDHGIEQINNHRRHQYRQYVQRHDPTPAVNWLVNREFIRQNDLFHAFVSRADEVIGKGNECRAEDEKPNQQN